MSAKIPNVDAMLGIGLDPKTGLPIKMSGGKVTVKEDVKKFLRIIDEQDAVNRYVWKNLPCSITSQELERLIYYRGQLCFFKLEDEYYFTPYALDGTIDFYGRYNKIHPVPMTNGEDKVNKAATELLANIKLDCIYKKDAVIENPDKCTVLIHDYTKQSSNTIIPRQSLNDPLLDIMANCIPYMNTSMLLSTGIKGMRVADADQYDAVICANRSMERAALTGEAYVPIVGSIEFQELANEVGDASEFMMAFQSLDNLRLQGYGIKTSGAFQKKAQVLQAEEDVNDGPVGLVLQDGLDIRQNFCDIANAVFGLDMSVEANEKTKGEKEEVGYGDDDPELPDETVQ